MEQTQNIGNASFAPLNVWLNFLHRKMLPKTSKPMVPLVYRSAGKLVVGDRTFCARQVYAQGVVHLEDVTDNVVPLAKLNPLP